MRNGAISESATQSVVYEEISTEIESKCLEPYNHVTE